MFGHSLPRQARPRGKSCPRQDFQWSLMSTRYTGFRASTAQQLTAEPGTSEALRRDRFLILTETVTPPPAIASELAATGKSVAQVDAEARRPEDFHVPELG